MKTIATYNLKGGVGKTTTAVNLAFEAAHAGARVLVWDLDPQGAATWMLRVKANVKGGADKLLGRKGELERHLRATAYESVTVMPADFSLRNLDVALDDVARPSRRLAKLLGPVADRFDLALIDCAPAISLASESVFRAADALVVPTIPSPLAVRTLQQLADFLDDWPDPPMVLPFVSMLDRRRATQRHIADDLRRDWPALLPTAVPSAGVVEQMSVRRAAVAEYAPRSAAALAYRRLWADISARIWS